jgi:signal transduction histidine kinase
VLVFAVVDGGGMQEKRRGDQDTAVPSGPRVSSSVPQSLVWALAETSGAAHVAIWGDQMLVTDRERFCALFGAPPEVVAIGSAVALAQWLSADARDTSIALVKLLTAPELRENGEITSSTDDRVIEWRAAAIGSDEDNTRTIGRAWAFREVTLQRRAALALRDAESLLAAGVAHEINNPLAYMLLNLERLQAGLRELSAAGGNAAATAEQFSAIEASVQMTLEGARRVQQIVHDLQEGRGVPPTHS